MLTLRRGLLFICYLWYTSTSETVNIVPRFFYAKKSGIVDNNLTPIRFTLLNKRRAQKVLKTGRDRDYISSKKGWTTENLPP
jgi:hypothetical protein